MTSDLVVLENGVAMSFDSLEVKGIPLPGKHISFETLAKTSLPYKSTTTKTSLGERT